MVDAVLPSDVMFGVSRHLGPDDSEDKFDYKIKLLNRLRASYEDAERKREKQMNYYKEQYNRTHKNVNFKIGSEVMFYWHVTKQDYTHKLLPSWQGPDKVLAKLSDLTYRIEKDNKSFVIHVQRLRPYKRFE